MSRQQARGRLAPRIHTGRWGHARAERSAVRFAAGTVANGTAVRREDPQQKPRRNTTAGDREPSGSVAAACTSSLRRLTIPGAERR